LSTKPFVVEQAHSPLGPSSSERWLNCFGSTEAIKGVPNEESEYSTYGTAAHTVSEWCRQQGCSAKRFLGRTLKVGAFNVVVDAEMVRIVDDFCEYVNTLPGYPMYETLVHYTDYVPNGFGTMDDARIQDGLCYVTDFKTGKGIVVSAENNSQLKLYALGLYHDYKHLWQFNRFVLTIHQTRRNYIDVWEISLTDLLRWAQTDVRWRAKKALSGKGELNGGPWCQKGFCPLRKTCEAHLAWKAAELQAEIDVAKEFENLDD
jgi:hypothetical protein